MTAWVRFDKYGAYFTVRGGVLLTRPITADGEMSWEEPGEVTAIDDERDPAAFCRDINKTFGTAFAPADFPGR